MDHRTIGFSLDLDLRDSASTFQSVQDSNFSISAA
jgi:hypothetical protein